jgi:hypothetical protein
VRTRLTRISLLVVMLFGLVATTAGRGGASPLRAPVPLDLATIPLTPDEVAAAGLEDYGWSHGQLRDRYEILRDYPAWYGVPREEFEATMMEEAGLMRAYTHRNARPIERGKAGTLATRALFTDVFQFESAAGAAVGDAFMAEAGMPSGAEPVEGTREFGDHSRLIRFAMPDPETDDPIEGMSLLILTGELYVDLTLWDVIRPGEEVEAPTVEEMEALGVRLMMRIAAARAGDLPDLGSRIVRLGGEGSRMFYTADRYEVQYGQYLQHFLKSVADYEASREAILERGLLHRYAVIQDVVSEPYDWTKAPSFMTAIDRLAGTEEAGRWFAGAPSRVEQYPFMVESEPVEQDLALGDEALAFATTVDFGGGPMPGHVVVVRSGNDVFDVWVHAPDGVSLETAIDLARIQLGCLIGDQCPERVPVPADMRVG